MGPIFGLRNFIGPNTSVAHSAEWKSVKCRIRVDNRIVTPMPVTWMMKD